MSFHRAFLATRNHRISAGRILAYLSPAEIRRFFVMMCIARSPANIERRHRQYSFQNEKSQSSLVLVKPFLTRDVVEFRDAHPAASRFHLLFSECPSRPSSAPVSRDRHIFAVPFPLRFSLDPTVHPASRRLGGNEDRFGLEQFTPAAADVFLGQHMTRQTYEDRVVTELG